ncbi:unnamed protein product [Sphagnum balticum]
MQQGQGGQDGQGWDLYTARWIDGMDRMDGGKYGLFTSKGMALPPLDTLREYLLRKTVPYLISAEEEMCYIDLRENCCHIDLLAGITVAICAEELLPYLLRKTVLSLL